MIEIGAMSPGSGTKTNPSKTIAKYFTRDLNPDPEKVDFVRAIYSAFNNTKMELSRASSDSHVGGKTFISRIDPKKGYEDISDKLE